LLFKFDAVCQNGYIFIFSNFGQYLLLKWTSKDMKFILEGQGEFRWAQAALNRRRCLRLALEIFAGRVFILDNIYDKIRFKNLSNLRSPEIVCDFGNALSCGGVRIMSSQDRKSPINSKCTHFLKSPLVTHIRNICLQTQSSE
jgi:hypothetical protein